jgi:hypothetical protein
MEDCTVGINRGVKGWDIEFIELAATTLYALFTTINNRHGDDWVYAACSRHFPFAYKVVISKQ